MLEKQSCAGKEIVYYNGWVVNNIYSQKYNTKYCVKSKLQYNCVEKLG